MVIINPVPVHNVKEDDHKQLERRTACLVGHEVFRSSESCEALIHPYPMSPRHPLPPSIDQLHTNTTMIRSPHAISLNSMQFVSVNGISSTRQNPSIYSIQSPSR